MNLEQFVTSEDTAEMQCVDCGTFLHIGSETLASVVKIAQDHAAGCVPREVFPGWSLYLAGKYGTL